VSPFPYTAIVLAAGAALGLVFAAGWAILRRDSDPSAIGTTGSTAVARAASYAGLAALLGVASWLGTPGIAILAMALGALGLIEWSNLAGLPTHHRIALQATNVAIIALVAVLGSGAAQWIVGGATLAGMSWPVVRPDPTRAMRDLGSAALGTILLPGMLAHGVALVVERGALGSAVFVALAVAVAASDVGAFVVGKRFGRTPLSPILSPAKTRAGVVGNLLGAAIGVAAFGPVLVAGFGVGVVLLLVPIVALGAVWGDLLESAAKREAQQKDAGHWLPGFGGILDRIDSLLITLPLVFWALRIVDLVKGTP
jgi:phosphatidate cytidylyltransferase